MLTPGTLSSCVPSAISNSTARSPLEGSVSPTSSSSSAPMVCPAGTCSADGHMHAERRVPSQQVLLQLLHRYDSLLDGCLPASSLRPRRCSRPKLVFRPLRSLATLSEPHLGPHASASSCPPYQRKVGLSSQDTRRRLSLECYKARWVVPSFTRHPNIDYGETFSPSSSGRLSAPF
jgi:hypothetical protein